MEITIGEKIKYLRNEKRLTQKELASNLSITIPTLSHWECNYQEPSSRDLVTLANFFDVSVDYLLGRTDDFGSAIPTVSPAPTLSSEEQRLVESYRGLGKPLRDLLWGFIETWQAQTASSTHKKA